MVFKVTHCPIGPLYRKNIHQNMTPYGVMLDLYMCNISERGGGGGGQICIQHVVNEDKIEDINPIWIFFKKSVSKLGFKS